MSEKFTKGPWKATYINTRISEAENYILVTGDKGEKVFDIEDICVNENDLALILAAPDLYASLETICHDCIGKEATDNVCEGCHVGKALRKARGEEEERYNGEG